MHDTPAHPFLPRVVLPRLTVGGVDGALRRELGRAAQLPLSYPDVGASLTGRTPAGYRAIHAAAVVGASEDQFHALATGIREWRIQTGAGVRVLANGPATIDADVALAKVAGPAAIIFACRVVWILDEPWRKGFAYGTLPGHPESGEEAIVTEFDGHDVTFRVFGFTRHGTTISTLAGPIASLMQERAITSYLRAAKAIATP